MSPVTASARRLATSASALVLMTGAGVGLAGAAHADPDDAPGQSQGAGQDDDHPGKAKGKKHKNRGHGNGHGPRGHANGHANGNNGNHGNGGDNGSRGNSGGGSTGGGQDDNGGGSQDPAGNNGTVKIAPLGEFDGIPNNTPHPGCTFLVEWYGFDEGAGIISKVNFAMHAPTSDVGLTVAGPAEVFVGEDPASGAGTDSGLDARQAYTLAFDGEPHPKQGYHVKLTVNTPRSNGADKKSKVFWVEPCESAAPGGTEDEGTEGSGTGGTEGTEGSGGESGVEGSVAGPQGGSGSGVMGEFEAPAGAGAAPDSAGAGDDAAVPTSVDAGDGRNPVMDAFTSPAGLAAILLGLLTAAGAFVLRRRATE